MALMIQALVIFSMLFLTRAIDTSSCAIMDNASSCVPYIEGQTTGNPSTDCCTGIKSIATSISSGQIDLVILCNCIKTVMSQIANALAPSRASDLSRICGSSVGLPPITQTYDCSKISSNM